MAANLSSGAVTSYGSFLWRCESKIVSCLSAGDLVPFAIKLIDQALLSDNVKEVLLTMYEDIPHKRRCRYVMQHVYKAVGTDKGKYKKFLEVLSNFPDGKVVVESRLRKSVREGFKNYSESFMVGMKDLGPLCSFLSDNASDWEKIGTVLLSDPNKNRCIRQECNADSILCLSRILEAWLRGESKCGMSPTIENLKESLRSSMVNLPRVADRLDEEWTGSKKIKISDSSSDSDSRDCVNIGENGREEDSLEKLLILGPRSITLPDDYVSVLFELDIRSECDMSKTYQWYKDGMLESITSHCFYCIRVRDITAAGIYTCHYEFGLVKTESEPLILNIKTPIDNLKQELVDRYLKEPEVNVDIWPATTQNTFIQLAVIQNGAIRLDNSFDFQTIRGNADDILSKKATCDYISSFKSLKAGEVVVVEGRPGSGKTTLVHKISQDWAMGKFDWKHIRLLFLVPLRGFQGCPLINLTDIIAYHFPSTSEKKTIRRYAEKYNGLGIGFILDGMDEYQPEDIKNTYINKLIEGKELFKALVVVASRPAAVAPYRKVANLRIEVLGFFKQQIREYIESYVFSSKSKCSHLLKYLEDHSNVHHMCYLPVQAAMICFLFDILDGNLPRTETKIYEEFTKHLLLRTVYRYKNISAYSLESIFDLENPERSYFVDICEVAFNKTVAKKQILLQTELGRLILKGSVHSSLGLIAVDMAATGCGFEKMYSFFHLTYQEFLAACHILLMSDEEQVHVIRKFGHEQYMRIVFKFYCGLIKFDENCSKFKVLLEVADLDLLEKYRCSFESQQKNTCELVVDANSIDVSNRFWSSSDMVVLGYIVINSKVKTLKLNIFLNSEQSEALSHEMNGRQNHIENIVLNNEFDYDKHQHMFDFIAILIEQSISFVTLTITSRSLEDLYLSGLATALKESRNFSSLNCSGTSMRDEDILCITDVVRQCKITSLNLSETNTTDVGIQSLSDALKNCYGLKYLNFSKNRICDDGAHALAVCLQNCYNLISIDLQDNFISGIGVANLTKLIANNMSMASLNLSRNMITDVGVEILVQDLKCFESLTAVELAENNISDEGVDILAQGLRNFTRLIALNLSGNLISDTGIGNLAHSFRHIGSLRELNLSANLISDMGTETLAHCLAQLKHLEALDLSENFISDGGVESLSFGLKYCRNMTTLKLSRNSISCSGAKVLAPTIQILTELSVLDVSKNNISDIGIYALSSSFQSLTNMKTLDLSENNISNAEVIGSAIKNLTNLTSLNLSGNSFSNSTGLVNALTSLTNLKALNLSRTNVSAVRDIVCVLENLRHLTALDLSGNNLSDMGDISSALEKLRNLRILDLSRNNICDFSKLSKLGTLTTLILTGNNISCSTKYFDSYGGINALKSLHNLTTLDLSEVCSIAGVVGFVVEDLRCLTTLNLSRNSFCDLGDACIHLDKLRNMRMLDLSGNHIDDDADLCNSLVNLRSLATLNLSGNNIYNGWKIGQLLKTLKNLTALDLSGNNFSFPEVLVHAIRKLTTLRKLVLNGTNISSCAEITLALENLRHLKILELSGNNFSDRTALCSTLPNLQNLSTLNISRTNVSDAKLIGNALRNLKFLTELDFSGNHIDDATELSHAIGSLKYLTTLMLSGNNFSDATAVVDILSKLNNLRTLDLSGNNFSDSTGLCRALVCLKNLTTLILCGASISDAKGLGHALESLQSLTMLDLSLNNLSDEGNIFYALEKLNNLVTLDLSGNHFSDTGPINRTLKMLGNLKALDLSRNSFSDSSSLHFGFVHLTNLRVLRMSQANILDIKAVIPALANLRFLTTLDLSGNSICNAAKLHHAFDCCSNLSTLNLSRTDITDAGSICYALENLVDLKTLDLSGNNISDASKLHSVGRKLTKLTELNLSGNNVSNAIVSCLISGNFEYLVVLDLSRNCITNVNCIFDAVKHLCRLKTLNLSRNCISDVGMECACRMKLEILDLSGNNISNVWNIFMAVENFKNLRSLDLSRNNISDVAKTEITIHGLRNLTTLNLSGNSICDVKAVSYALKEKLHQKPFLNLIF